MNEQEAKFILRAYRPDGRDATDPRFAEALTMAQQDPALRAWLERERALDTTVAAKLSTIAPPAGLRDAILAGARASRPRARWWSNPAWLATAAAIALMLSLALRFRAEAPPAPGGAALVAFAMDDSAYEHAAHVGHPGLDDVQASFAKLAAPLPGHLDFDFNEFKAKSCRTVSFAGRDVFEVCLQRDGKWYHVYAARAEDFAPGAMDPQRLLVSKGTFAATAWRDAHHVYAIVSTNGAAALKPLL